MAGGRIGRDYPLGHRRTDLLVQWPQGGHWDPERVSKHVIELKALRAGRGFDTTIEKGLRQTAEYMDRCKAESGHLLIFDSGPGKVVGRADLPEGRAHRRDSGNDVGGCRMARLGSESFPIYR